MKRPAIRVVVDGSNLATEGRSIPSLVQLDDAVRAFLEEYDHADVIVVVDASFEDLDARDFAPGRLCRKPSEMTRRYVWHAASVAWHQHDDGKYAWRDDDERARWLDVHASWLAIRAEDYFFQSVLTNHDAGHEPSVREVIDRAAEQAEPQDAIIWTGPFAKLPENALELARAVEGCTLISERVWAMTGAWWRQFGKYAICIGDELFACDGRWELSRERGPQFVPIEPVLAI